MSKVLVIDTLLEPDSMACEISRKFMTWEQLRAPKEQEWKEIQQYIFATDTTKTSNSKLPWSNKTTTPKLCQIRDNLYANYMYSMFPKRKSVSWEGQARDEETVNKKQAIENYISWVMDRNEFYEEMGKLICDYIDYGNAIGTVEWVDYSYETNQGKVKVGYTGPMVRRISPLDIVFNPAADSFANSPKIVRSLVSIGEIHEMAERDSLEEGEKEYLMALVEYMKGIRAKVNGSRNSQVKDNIYNVAGFTNFQSYLECNTVEILTFYGDIYDEDSNTFLRNHVVRIVDRHKILDKKPNVTSFGKAPFFHVGWRHRPDNLWAMGPLDNLVGMQYRIDHLENMKADVFDLIAYPPIAIKGYVEDFNWGPGERIIMGEDGAVTLMSPHIQALQADNQIAMLEAKMEEMAGSPKEAMGFRTPGEKTAYEVQRLENAASRIFQAKINQFERAMTENLLNACLELARRNLNETTIRVFNDEFKVAVFKDLSVNDITGFGRIKPYAARHFAEVSQQVQNISQFYGSAVGQDQGIKAHFSTIKLAKLFEELLDLEKYNIVDPFIRMSEEADAQKLQMQHQENLNAQAGASAGLAPDDFDVTAATQGPTIGVGGPPQGR